MEDGIKIEIEDAKPVRTFDVWQDDNASNFKYMGKVVTTNYCPSAQEIGEKFGGGEFMTRELDEEGKCKNYANFLTIEVQTFYNQVWD